MVHEAIGEALVYKCQSCEKLFVLQIMEVVASPVGSFAPFWSNGKWTRV